MSTGYLADVDGGDFSPVRQPGPTQLLQPMNELITDGVNGLLVPSHEDGLANSGIPAKTVDVDALTSAISRLADPDLRAELSAGALRVRDQRSWERTVEDFAALLR